MILSNSIEKHFEELRAERMESMLKAALIGLGRMGRGHFNVYKQFEKDGVPVSLVAVCDIDESKFSSKQEAEFNLKDVASAPSELDYSPYRCYTDYKELLEKEDVDFVDIVVPTYLHYEVTIAALKSGKHVHCEKPMALNPEQCAEMIATAKEMNKTLMIGQVLHFWNAYEILKKYTEEKIFGEAKFAFFYRGGVQDHIKNGSYKDWIRIREQGGGGLFDQHIHDTDMVRWLFGTPESVSTTGLTIHPRSAYDIVSTNYFYPDHKVVNANDDADQKGTYGFRSGYKVHFENGMLMYLNNKLTAFPHGAPEYEIELKPENPYYNEVKYFSDCVASGKPVIRCLPEEAMETVRICLAEMKSADLNGEKVAL